MHEEVDATRAFAVHIPVYESSLQHAQREPYHIYAHEQLKYYASLYLSRCKDGQTSKEECLAAAFSDGDSSTGDPTCTNCADTLMKMCSAANGAIWFMEG